MVKRSDCQRKKKFLRGSVQGPLMLRVYIILLTTMLISGAIFYFIGNKKLTMELYQAHSTIKTTMQLLFPALVLVNLLGLAGAFFLVLSFTHSVAGPIHRLKMLSGKIVDGDLTLHVAFRKKDLIHELSDVMNNVIQGLNTNLKRFDGSLKKMRMLSKKINNMDKLSPGELTELKKSFLSVSAELEDEMKRFTL